MFLEGSCAIPCCRLGASLLLPGTTSSRCRGGHDVASRLLVTAVSSMDTLVLPFARVYACLLCAYRLQYVLVQRTHAESHVGVMVGKGRKLLMR